MKKTLTKVLLLALVCALMLSLAACAEKNPASTDAPATTDAPASAASTESAAPAAEVDFTLYPADFSDWSIANLKAYLREAGVFEHDDWCFDMSAGDTDSIGATSGTMYIDTTGATVMDMIFYFDAKADESKQAILDGIKETRSIQPDVEGVPATPMDAMLDGFCFSYTMGADAEHNAALCKAIHALADHYGLTPDFITE